MLSVGAVAFDRRTFEERSWFYRSIDAGTSAAAGLTTDPETVAWWMRQDKAARTAAAAGEWTLRASAHDFDHWWKSLRPENVWAQGMDFDPPIWAAAMRAAGVAAPWKFWAKRDTRTAYDLAGFDPASVVRGGDHHNALDDARHQVRCLAGAARSMWGEPAHG